MDSHTPIPPRSADSPASAAFNSLPWHDAALLELSIDRRNPGASDEVCLQVAWPHGGEAALVFRDCYALTTDMHFGIIAPDRIAVAKLDEDDCDLVAIRERWESLGVPLEHLNCYRLEMSSTGSLIRIYSKQFEVAERNVSSPAAQA